MCIGRKSSLRLILAGGLWLAVPMAGLCQSFTFSTLAGNAGYGSADGPGQDARFEFPTGVAADSAGNLYVADTENSTIRRIDPAGIVTTLAGLAGSQGAADGTGSDARFAYPQGIAVDNSGNVYVADTANCTIRQITPDGTVTTLAGSPGVLGSSNGTNSTASFRLPGALTVDAAGVLYVADTYNNTIRKISQASTSSSGDPSYVVSTFAGSAGNEGYRDGPPSTAKFSAPDGIALDSKGNIFVADTGNNTIRKIDSALTAVTNFAGSGRLKTDGYVNGSATSAARFYSPNGLATDASDNLYVADTGNCEIREIVSTTDSSTGAVTVTVSSVGGNGTLAPGMLDGVGTLSAFFNPCALWAVKNSAAPNAGYIYIADTMNNSIRRMRISDHAVTTLAGTIPNVGSTDGLGSAARFHSPNGIALSPDKSGNLFVADNANYVIRKLKPSGGGSYVVTTYAGQTGVLGTTDGVTTEASFAAPMDLAVDKEGELFVPDSSEGTIRMIVPNGAGIVVSTPAGMAGTSGSTDGIGTAVRFQHPIGAAVYEDADGNRTVYISDSVDQTIRKMGLGSGATTNGVVTTLAGSSGTQGSTDGVGTDTSFNAPQGIAIDSKGQHLFVADTGNETIRMITFSETTAGSPIATVSTLAGMVGTRGHVDGTGSLAQFEDPYGLIVDPADDNVLYIADSNNQTIRKVTISTTNGVTLGTVSTVVGVPGSPGYFDGTGADIRFHSPMGVTADSDGNLFVVDTANETIRKVAFSNSIPTASTIAGVPSTASYGDADGPHGTERFSEPYGLAVDASGTIYESDSGSHTIRKIDSTGSVTTIAGTPQWAGGVDGTGGGAEFSHPYGIAVDSNKNIYVADSFNATIRRISPDGLVQTLAGMMGEVGSSDGTGSAAYFDMPAAVALDSANNIYVADCGNDTIRKITLSSTDAKEGVVTTMAGLSGSSGYWDAQGLSARFNAPSGVAVDSGGNVYVADKGNNLIRMVTQAGVVSTLAGSTQSAGNADGVGTSASFNGPSAIAVDAERNLYVTDSNNQLIRRITPAGVVTTLAGSAGIIGAASGTGSYVRFSNPKGIAVDGSGRVYVADTDNNMVRVGSPASSVTTKTVTTDTVTGTTTTVTTTKITTPNGTTTTITTTTVVTAAGVTTTNTETSTEATGGTNSDLSHVGSPNSSQGVYLFFFPTNVTGDSSGNLYVADPANNTIQKVTSAGVVTTLAGLSAVVGTTDAGGTHALFNQPNGITMDGNGNIFVADTGNGTIRKIASDGTVTTVAGSATNRGNRDGSGTGAWFSAPTGIAADASGNLFVADAFTDTIRKITSSGTVTTVAGSSTVRGHADGSGTAALFNYPTGVAVDSSGNLFVADSFNDLVRKITPAGVVSTLAGDYNIAASFDGTGSNAYFNQPAGVAVDSSGAVYVADTGNSTIRRIGTDGTVTTVAGVAGLSGLYDATGTNALFNQPKGLFVNSSGSIYVADSGNAAIRKISGTAVVSTPTMTLGNDINLGTIPKGSSDSTNTGSLGAGSTTGSGGGGGAVNPLFAGVLALLGISRWLSRRRRA